MFDDAVIALYIPIIIYSGYACYLYATRVLIPALIAREFRLEKHAVALYASVALTAHFTENIYYALIRTDYLPFILMSDLTIVLPMKLMILFSCILAVAVYNRAVFGKQNLLRLNFQAVMMWLAAFIVLRLW